MRNYLRIVILLCLGSLSAGLFGQGRQAVQAGINDSRTTARSSADFVPEHRTCGSVEQMEQNFERFPELRNSYARHLRDVERIISQGDYQRTSGLITIPVVVHVIYRNSTQNISTAQVTSQIDVLTEDYRRQNSDAGNTPSQWQSIAADCGVEFCLATQDPQGNATTGITRTQTSTANIGSTNQYYQVAPAWNRNSYLNIWVCEIGGGILGFAQFPGTAPASYDGVVIDYRYFGTTGTATSPFNKGRTGTHEVGHWLGLRHIWGDGGCGVDDGIADTPESDAANYFCPTNHSSCGSTDMVQNYMDYTNDACMNIFTQGQSSVVNATLSGSRGSLVFSQGCTGGGGGGGGCDTSEVNYPLAGTPTLYGSGGTGAWGTISGHNNYGDEGKAERFDNSQGITQVFGVRLQFGLAASAGPTSKVTVQVWNESGGQPGTSLIQQDLLIDDIIAGSGDVTVMFPSPVSVSGPFYAGITLTYAAGDTVGLITNTDGDTSPATAWELWNTGDWYPYDDANSWGLDLGHAIFPIAIQSNMQVTVSPSSPTITAGNSVSLTASGASTYSWSPSTGLSCTNCSNPTASPSTTTTYTVTGTDASGQCSTEAQVTVTVQTVGVEDALFGGQIAAYPNPGEGQFVLDFDRETIGDLEIAVFNNLGQQVYGEHLSDFTGNYHKTIDMRSVPAGVYHLTITDGKDRYTQQLVFE